MGFGALLFGHVSAADPAVGSMNSASLPGPVRLWLVVLGSYSVQLVFWLCWHR